jgi:adenine-specific DNA-methyltransferase
MLPNSRGPDLSLEKRKETGAFYTPPEIVEFLTGWALEGSPRHVLDPSCGDGRFLLQASRQAPRLRLTGVDVEAEALAATRESLHPHDSRLETQHGDFFALDPRRLGPVDAVIGNPPFIRYQQFKGLSRRLALESALSQGIRLSRLTSSWAPFLLHGMRFLRPGGRLGMVVPAEITQTRYGLQTLRAISDRFGCVRLVAFEQNPFADAQVETFLLMAKDFGSSTSTAELCPVSSASQLKARSFTSGRGAIDVPLDPEESSRFAEAYLTRQERRTWRKLRRHPGAQRLGSLATICNGYVTGDNEFFHRTVSEARELDLPPRWLYPVARSSKSLRGLFWTAKDVAHHEASGTAHHLVVPREDLFRAAEEASLDRWLAEGVERKTPQRFKCRKRTPWWRVPGLQQADVLVGYMAGAYPRAAVNEIDAAYTNSLHGLRLREPAEAVSITLGLYSSLALLSLELEGRSYGGGILKIEPRELHNVVVPLADLSAPSLQRLAKQVDPALRDGDYDRACREVDEAFLVQGLGLSTADVGRLRSARFRLLERRTTRSRKR